MKINYRKLGQFDSKQYRKIRLESLKAHPESFGTTYEEQSKLPKLMFEKAIERPLDERFVFGAFDQGELIGICGYVPFLLNEVQNLSSAGTIIQMYVRSNYSGLKIGLNLTKRTVQEAFRVSDVKQIVLGVRKGNISAIRVYEQAGFRPYQLEGEEGKCESKEFIIMIYHKNQLK